VSIRVSGERATIRTPDGDELSTTQIHRVFFKRWAARNREREPTHGGGRRPQRERNRIEQLNRWLNFENISTNLERSLLNARPSATCPEQLGANVQIQQGGLDEDAATIAVKVEVDIIPGSV